jgi:hypothetical protein
MGVEAVDLDGSGRPSLFVTNFQARPNLVFLNRGSLLFQDWHSRSGLNSGYHRFVGWGTAFIDADLDGQLDLAIANGNFYRTNDPETFGGTYAQEPQFFLGTDPGRFREVSTQVGGYFLQRRTGRGIAWADYDNDGLPDLAFNHNEGPLALLRNTTATDHNWLRLELIGDGKKSNRNAIGARIEIESGPSKQVRFLTGGGSYLSASDRRQLVGLGSAARADRVTVLWPSGRRQVFRDLPARRWFRFHEGNEQPEVVAPPKPVRPGS